MISFTVQRDARGRWEAFSIVDGEAKLLSPTWQRGVKGIVTVEVKRKSLDGRKWTEKVNRIQDTGVTREVRGESLATAWRRCQKALAAHVQSQLPKTQRAQRGNSK